MVEVWGEGPVRKEAFLLKALFAYYLFFIGAHYLAMLGLGYFVATK